MITFLVTLSLFNACYCYHQIRDRNNMMTQVLAWKQISYNIDGFLYNADADQANKLGSSQKVLNDSQKYFIQYNNVPIGFEKFRDKLFITVPRRRYGIPSTLNFVTLGSKKVLQQYPGSQDLVSVYRPRVDSCQRLWMVDTGMLEVPGARRQLQPPSIVVYDLKTNKRILKYELKSTDLIDERTPAGLTSITVEVDSGSCNNAYAYINDLATDGILVFSMAEKKSWRIEHPAFVYDDEALNFKVAGHNIDWKDGAFSLALTGPDAGRKRIFFHPLASFKEFSIDTEDLKNGRFNNASVKYEGSRGSQSQSGSHDYHHGSRAIFFANVARDAILCWNIDKELTPESVAMVTQDHNQLVYISDLKVIGDEIWVLVNQIPRFVYSTLDKQQDNFFIHKGNVYDLIHGTVCV